MSDEARPRDRAVVFVPTRGRTDYLRRCLASILEHNGTATPVFVVDQDRDHSGARVCAEFGGSFADYLPYPTGGKSAALNAGLAATDSEYAIFTDDDCTVPPDWVERGLASLEADASLGLVFGGAVACEHDPATEFVPSYVPPRREVRRGRMAVRKIGGLGGDLFARRAALEAAGGFDERLGPGTSLFSAEDQDLNNRVLRAGFSVLADPALRVTHWGVRRYADEDVGRLLRGYSRGIGALAMKDLRRGTLAGLYPVVRELGAEGRWALRRALGREPAPFVLRSPSLFAGMARGAVMGIDGHTGRFA